MQRRVPSWIRAALAAAVLICMPLLHAGPALAVNAFDREIMEFVQNNRTEDLDHLMKTMSDEWKKENFLLVAVPVTLWGSNRSFLAVEESFKAITLAEAVVSPLKYVTGRKRPTGVTSRANSSFPSSHAATSFAAASSIGHIYPKARIPAYAVAALIAYSRIYNQRHYASDVIAGAGIGVVAAKVSRAYLSWLQIDREGLKQRLPFRIAVDSDGRGVLRIYISRPL